MSERNPSRYIAIALVGLFLFGSLGAAVGALPSGGRVSSRDAADTEPNDNTAQAVPISSGDVVQGSLLVAPGGDRDDYYRIDVPYGQMLNVSLYMDDYNSSDPGQYNFQLYLLGPPGGMGGPANLDTSATMNRWECTAGIQYWNASAPQTMYIQIEVNQSGYPPAVHTLPANYTLTATVSDVPVFTTDGPEVDGWLDGGTGPAGRAFFRLDPGPADYQQMLSRLESPATGADGIYVYMLWDINGGWYLRNESVMNNPGQIQDAIFNGCGGTYYVKLAGLSGNGTYKLTCNSGNSWDDNNIYSKAALVHDLYPRESYIDEGANWVDWWRVNATAGRPITEAYLLLEAGLYQAGSSFTLYAYDQNLKLIVSAPVPHYQGYTPVYNNQLENITVGYNGTVYFAVCAGTVFSFSGGFAPARGWYKLSFTLPNDAPVCLGGLPEIHMLEETTDDSLVLLNYFMDPNNDSLAFTLLGSSYHTHPKINATSSRVTFTPDKNWFGSELVRFQCTDDGPGNKWVFANTTVFVSWVNKPPVVSLGIDDIVIPEDSLGATPDLTTIFADPDDPLSNLTFHLNVVEKEVHPPTANLTLAWDSSTHSYRLGPARFMFGAFVLEASCVDTHPGTIPATVRFNLTVTHRDHAPALAAGVLDPTMVQVTEHGNNTQLVLPELFVDPDLPADYANDSLNFTVTGMKKLVLSILPNGQLLIDTGTEQYYPGVSYEERLLVTAKDRPGLKATLNLTVQIIPVDDPPFITSASPAASAVNISEGMKQTFRVTAADNDTTELIYAWLFDGVRDRYQSASLYSFVPDFTMGGSTHALAAVVSDGTSNVTMQWTLRIADINRPPTASISSPLNFTKFKKGAFITFTADASDPDGDPLTFTWSDGSGAVLGTGSTISTDKLQKGTQTVRLEVSDGKAGVSLNVTVVISSPPAPAASKGFIPGFGAAAAVAAAVLAVSALSVLRRRREG
jgi:hypothetical protein